MSGDQEESGQSEALPFHTKAIYALGDHTINLGLASMLFIYPFFLTDVAGISAGVAAFIPLVGRIADAFSDPLMGRLSDRSRWKYGRRRPFFLVGMVPLGLSYAAMWWNTEGMAEQTAANLYTAIYVVFSLSMTVIAVPYLAIIPEMTSSYDERTSLNAWRAVGAIFGALLAAAAVRPIADAFGGGPEGFQQAGLVLGVWIMMMWPFIHRVTFERPPAHAGPDEGLLRSIGSLVRHLAFIRLTGIYIMGRIAIDLTSTMFLYYFTWWLGRPDDFGPTLALFLACVALSMPMWTAISRRVDKHTIFLLGAASWIGSQALLFLAQPDWPRWWIFVGAAIGGVGYAAADMIPWSMLGDVVDEDELRTGHRREGVYFGLFMFLRKLGGASAVALALYLLGMTGYVGGDGISSQPDESITAIRVLTAVVPSLFVALAALLAFRFPIGRARHAEILVELDARRAAEAVS
jgi:sugar (glycoside-pentoside-hexuronide) transporter